MIIPAGIVQAEILTLGRVSYFVLDECDFMLEQGFKHQLTALTSQVSTPQHPSTHASSAAPLALPHDPQYPGGGTGSKFPALLAAHTF